MIHLEDGPAFYQPCPRCGRHTLTAYCAGVKTRLDPEPLSINAEIAALILGRRTYDVLVMGLPRRMYPAWRHLSRIRAPRIHAVIATHICPPNPVRPQSLEPETEITIPSLTTVPDKPLF